MKKIILVVLMVVMVATPCFAQEVETEVILSIEGTKWEPTNELWILPIPFIPIIPFDISVGFAGGEVYPTTKSPYFLLSPVRSTFYIDTPLGSIFMYVCSQSSLPLLPEVGLGILYPYTGIGYMTWFAWYHIPGLVMVKLIKTDDNWTPPNE